MQLARKAVVADEPKPVWMVNAPVDLIFCCGGGVWIVHALVSSISATPYRFSAEVAASLVFLSAFMKYIFADPHTAATLHRIYASKENRDRWGLYTKWLAGFSAVAIGVGLLVPGAGPHFARLYTVWVMPHWMSQIYGIALIYCYRSGYVFTKFEKRILWLLLHSVGLVIVLETFLPGRAGPMFIVQTPKWFDIPVLSYELAYAGFRVLLGGFLLIVASKAYRESQFIPLPAALLLATGILIQLAGHAVFQDSRYYIVGFYHGAQYLVVCAGFHMRSKRVEEGPALREEWLKFSAAVIVGGILIYSIVPKAIEDFFRIPVAVSFPIVFSVANFHHFLTDQAIWKLRKPENKTLFA